MLKIFVILGMGIIGLFLLDLQLTSSWSCTAEVDLGMRGLNDRKAAYLEKQQQLLEDAIEKMPSQEEETQDFDSQEGGETDENGKEIAPPKNGYRYYP